MPPKFRIQTYDLPAECPRPRRRSQAQLGLEIGYMKANFFSNIGYHKPSLTLFVFDFTKHDVNEKWDWPEIEVKVLAQIKNHSETWGQKELQVPSKYIVIFLLPQNVAGLNSKEH